MGNDTSARKYVYFWGEFAMKFHQNYTVKWLENEYSNSQGLREQEYIERTNKPIK